MPKMPPTNPHSAARTTVTASPLPGRRLLQQILERRIRRDEAPRRQLLLRQVHVVGQLLPELLRLLHQRRHDRGGNAGDPTEHGGVDHEDGGRRAAGGAC